MSRNITDDVSPRPPKEAEDVNATTPAKAADLTALAEQIKKLVEKLDAPKRKGIWDIFPVLTTFMGTVVLAGISLYVTQSYQRQEAERTRAFQTAEAERAAKFNEAQLQMQRGQMRVEELKALTALAPFLSSRDAAAQATARQLLQAIKASGSLTTFEEQPADSSSSGPNTKGNNSGGSGFSVANPAIRVPARPSSSVLDNFAAIMLSPEASADERVTATRRIGDLATSRTATPALRQRAANLVAQVAVSPDVPPAVKEAAEEVIAKIKSVSPEEIASVVASQSYKRNITEVILHDAGIDANRYKGAETIKSIARSQLGLFKSSYGWHYAISEDGVIWLGVPLDQAAVHVPHHKERSVSIMLFMNGTKENPTAAQQSSLKALLRALFDRLKIEPNPDAPDGVGFHFHRDYDKRRSCPGNFLTKEMVIGWVKQ